MPHITIEHSKCIDEQIIRELSREIPKMMSKINDGNFSVQGCKVRASSFDKYLVGGLDQSSSSFCHITIKILAGRSEEIKVELAQKAGELAKEWLQNRKNLKEKNDLSVDIVDMSANTYQKISY